MHIYFHIHTQAVHITYIEIKKQIEKEIQIHVYEEHLVDIVHICSPPPLSIGFVL